jgi:hypothetical protein
MHLEVKIPIKTYLKKFIARTHSVEPFVVSKGKCHFSSIIMDPIKKEFKKDTLKIDEEIYTNLSVMIPLTENRFGIDQETVLRINQRLKSMFDQQISDMVSMTNKKKGDIFESVKKFTDYYDITEDDLKFETVIKMYFRARYPTESKKLVTEEMKRVEQLTLFNY